jgi:molybdenum cofactor biosynthesis enzyme MoaA
MAVGVPQLDRIGKRNGKIHQSDVAVQNLCDLRATFCMAQEMGKGLG